MKHKSLEALRAEDLDKKKTKRKMILETLLTSWYSSGFDKNIYILHLQIDNVVNTTFNIIITLHEDCIVTDNFPLTFKRKKSRHSTSVVLSPSSRER